MGAMSVIVFVGVSCSVVPTSVRNHVILVPVDPAGSTVS